MIKDSIRKLGNGFKVPRRRKLWSRVWFQKMIYILRIGHGRFQTRIVLQGQGSNETLQDKGSNTKR